MEKFEYKTIQINLAEAYCNLPDHILSEQGANGWEVIHIENSDMAYCKYLLMKRTGKNYGV